MHRGVKCCCAQIVFNYTDPPPPPPPSQSHRHLQGLLGGTHWLKQQQQQQQQQQQTENPAGINNTLFHTLRWSLDNLMAVGRKDLRYLLVLVFKESNLADTCVTEVWALSPSFRGRVSSGKTARDRLRTFRSWCTCVTVSQLWANQPACSLHHSTHFRGIDDPEAAEEPQAAVPDNDGLVACLCVKISELSWLILLRSFGRVGLSFAYREESQRGENCSSPGEKGQGKRQLVSLSRQCQGDGE